MGATLPAESYPLTGADQAVVAARTTYRGITVRETAGAAATVRVFDSADATGTLLDSISLLADGSFTVLYDGGLWAQHGVYVEVTGAVEGSIRIA